MNHPDKKSLPVALAEMQVGTKCRINLSCCVASKWLVNFSLSVLRSVL
jgi:hypothetical protein